MAAKKRSHKPKSSKAAQSTLFNINRQTLSMLFIYAHTIDRHKNPIHRMRSLTMALQFRMNIVYTKCRATHIVEPAKSANRFSETVASFRVVSIGKTRMLVTHERTLPWILESRMHFLMWCENYYGSQRDNKC